MQAGPEPHPYAPLCGFIVTAKQFLLICASMNSYMYIHCMSSICLSQTIKVYLISPTNSLTFPKIEEHMVKLNFKIEGHMLILQRFGYSRSKIAIIPTILLEYL